MCIRDRGGSDRLSAYGSSRTSYFARAFRVAAAFFAEADRVALGRAADAAPPRRPPLRIGEWSSRLPYPLPPGFSPPLWTLLTVAQARRSASSLGRPRRS